MKKENHKWTEEETRKKFHDFMFSEEGYISIEQAIKEVNKKYPETIKKK